MDSRREGISVDGTCVDVDSVAIGAQPPGEVCDVGFTAAACGQHAEPLRVIDAPSAPAKLTTASLPPGRMSEVIATAHLSAVAGH